MVGKRKRDAAAQVADAAHADAAGADVSRALMYTPAQLARGVESVLDLAEPDNTSLLVKLSVDNGEYVHIWVEDRTSKKQWQTDKLAAADFVGENAAIPGATVSDYATCFINCINASTGDDNSVEFVNFNGAEGDLEMHLTIKVKVFVSEWALKYRFLLQHVAVEPVDRVFAKLRDQEEKINQQDAKIEELEAVVRELTKQPPRPKEHRPPPMFIRLDAAKKVGKDQVIPWHVTGGEQVVETRDHGPNAAVDRIVFKTPIVFAIHAYIVHSSSASGLIYELQLNDATVATCIDSTNAMSSLSDVLQIARNDVFSVVYRGNGSAYKDSYLIAYELR